MIVALLSSFSPAFFPSQTPKRQMKKVTTPIIREDNTASVALYSEIAKPTESASMLVATA